MRQIVRGDISIPCGLATLVAEDNGVPRPARVSLYTLNDSKNVNSGNKKISRDTLSWKVFGGGLESSGMDLLKFGILLCDGKIISPASLKKMTTRVESDKSFCMGCGVDIENGVQVFAKDGAQPGASSYIWCVPERRMVMVVLTNRKEGGGAPALGKQLRKILLNTGAATDEEPDLIVENFKKTATPTYKNGKWEIPFQFDVKNIGHGAANIQFVNGIRVGNGTGYQWSGFVTSIAPNGIKKSVTGVLKVADPAKLKAGQLIKLTAMADAPIAAADTSMSPEGRITESNETNNEMAISLTLPGQGISGFKSASPHRAGVPSTSPSDKSRANPKSRLRRGNGGSRQ